MADPQENSITVVEPSSRSLTISVDNLVNKRDTGPVQDISVASLYESVYKYAESARLSSAFHNNKPSLLDVSSFQYSSYEYAAAMSI